MSGAPTPETRDYEGSELELFAAAVNWKACLAARMGPYIRGQVLEAGAGIGGNTRIFWNPRITGWLALEPDPAQIATIEGKIAAGELPALCRAMTGTTASLDPAARFDTILYVDVLEHIEDDRAELARAFAHLAPGGHVIVLSPAHQFLFSPFDAAIGHFRRYGRASLLAVAPEGGRLVTLKMLDAAGFFLSLGNRLVTRASMPTRGQIALWDRLFVPLSRWLDPLTGFRFGKSILAVWRRDA